mmetsp:Transcript_8355/g.9246  ORF Transcript_8355/g.9246 Transcript_8355/m.9246 type:complete len:586 (+) Transcript_8355:1-1758(+)
MTHYYYLTLLLVILNINYNTVVAEKNPTIQIPFGTLIGNTNDNGSDEYLGIPYAKEPIRFANPIEWDEPYEDDERDATKRGAHCIQYKHNLIDGSSEDCLFLNIWRPSSTTTQTEDLPVMVFIHGGAFISGSSMSSIPFPSILEDYSGRNLAQEQNIIVASMNYRVGVFGFAAFDDDDDDSSSRSNFGLKDQRMAIEWLYNYIPYFGGNPKSITIFGESAGGMSVLAHVASNNNLIQGAIVQSGYPIAFSWDQAIDVTRQYSDKVGCKTEDIRSCLRTVSVRGLLRANSLKPTKWVQQQNNWKPVVDGQFLSEHPLKLLSETNNNNIPLLIGWNTDDAALFVNINNLFGFVLPGSFSNWLKRFTRTHNIETQLNVREIQEVTDLYSDGKNDKDKASTIATDGTFLCAAKAAAQAYNNNNNNNVFVYRFNQLPSCASLSFLAKDKVYHTLELPYVFNTSEEMSCTFDDDKDYAVGLRMRTMWSNFAKYQNPSLLPSDENIPYTTEIDTNFPEYTKENHTNLVFHGDGDYMDEINYREETYCSFWQDKIYSKLLNLDMGPPEETKPEEEKVAEEMETIISDDDTIEL